jgi:type IV secretory pathway ATPase VirB11/archaellum biosynthesis ATPase
LSFTKIDNLSRKGRMVQSKIHIPADLIFHQSTEWDDLKFYYLMSKDIPTKRFGIRVDQKYLNYKNEKIKNFKHYGPNEQYLLNRIFDGPKNIIYIVGAIGSGKTTFIDFLLNIYIEKINIIIVRRIVSKNLRQL